MLRLCHPSRFSRRFLAWLFVGAALVTVTWLRVELVGRLADQGHFAKYTHFAARIAAGELPVQRLGDLSPGYLWTLSALMGPLGLDFHAVRTVQVVLGSLIAVLCAAAAWRVAGRAAAVTAAIAVLGSRAVLLNATEAEPETLILLLNSAALAALLGGRGATWRLAAGLLFGLSAVTRPTVLPAVILIAMWLWVSSFCSASMGGFKAVRRALPLGFIAGVALPLLILELTYSAIPGARTLMNPGTVFYEGSNPDSTGLAGDAPLVVKEVEPSFGQPDALHLAYRRVAEAATSAGASHRATNAFWGDRARAFMAAHPGSWLQLELAKLRFALSSAEAWDLATMVRKERELSGLPWLPFAVVVAAAGLALAAPRRDGATISVGLYAAGYLLVLLLFYVTSRQRAPLLPALAILAGCGVQWGIELCQDGGRRKVAIALLFALGIAVALGIPSHTHREDQHEWQRRFAFEAAVRNAAAARDPAARERWQGRAALLGDQPASRAEVAGIRAAIDERLATPMGPAERFDTALAAMRIGDWETAERLLAQLARLGYRPRRGALATSSIAYHRARCRLHMGLTNGARELLLRARAEAPGEAMILALTAAVARRTGADELDLRATRELAALHDPFTARLAAARAAADCGDLEGARRLLVAVAGELPEWPRPMALAGSAELAP